MSSSSIFFHSQRKKSFDTYDLSHRCPFLTVCNHVERIWHTGSSFIWPRVLALCLNVLLVTIVTWQWVRRPAHLCSARMNYVGCCLRYYPAVVKSVMYFNVEPKSSHLPLGYRKYLCLADINCPSFTNVSHDCQRQSLNTEAFSLLQRINTPLSMFVLEFIWITLMAVNSNTSCSTVNRQ